MITGKLHIVVLAALAALGAGCAMESQPNEDPVQQTESELTKANTANAAKNAESLGEESPAGNGVQVKPPAVVHILKTDHVVSGGETDDGPRPHPWEPNPEQSDSNKTSDNTNSGGSTGSSPTK